MKMFKPWESGHAKTAEVRHVKQEKKKNFLGSLTVNKGHTLFSINLVTYELKKAKFEQEYFDGKKNHKKVVVEENCLYKSALNAENFRRWFLNYLRNNAKQDIYLDNNQALMAVKSGFKVRTPESETWISDELELKALLTILKDVNIPTMFCLL